MNIKILEPLFLHEVGQRSNNEDCIMPLAGKATTATRIFVVCDGVGGQEKGEVASSIVSQVLHNYLLSHPEAPAGKEFFNLALKEAERQLQLHLDEHPECTGMSTTATVLWIKDDGIHLAWAGDSRIYHFRRGERLYRTSDHSLVQEFVDRGQLTEDEAQSHPSSNVILRAISSPKNPSEMDYKRITNLEEGDVFLLCTDGIIEKLSSSDLARLGGLGDREMMCDHIAAYCAKHSQDNYSMYLLELAEVRDASKAAATIEDSSPASDIDVKKRSQKDKSKLPMFLGAGLLALALLIGFMSWNGSRKAALLKEKQVAIFEKGNEQKELGNHQAALEIYKEASILDPENSDLDLRILEMERAIERQGLESQLHQKLKSDLSRIDADHVLAIADTSLSLSDSIVLSETRDLKKLMAESRFYLGLGDTTTAAQQIKGKESLPYSKGVLDVASYRLLSEYYATLISADSSYTLNQINCLLLAGDISEDEAEARRMRVPGYVPAEDLIENNE